MKQQKENIGNKNKWWLLSLIAISFLCVKCNPDHTPDCFKSAGKETTVRRNVGTFQSLELRDFIQIELIDSQAHFVEIVAPSHLISKITTTVEDGVLYVKNENTCNFVRSFQKKITVRIYAPDISDIQNYGTGDIISKNVLSFPYLKVENHHAAGKIDLRLQSDTVAIYTHTGVCDVVLRGTVFKAALFDQGVGWIDARNLQCRQAFVNNSSINDISVRPIDYLSAYIRYSGNIYCYGTPQGMDKKITGNGHLLLLP